jgi:cytochrome b561
VAAQHPQPAVGAAPMAAAAGLFCHIVFYLLLYTICVASVGYLSEPLSGIHSEAYDDT